jgi:hypothetical protein
MYTNEQEAKNRWCHLTLIADRAKCLASECMAWRWSEYPPHVYEKYDAESTEIKETPEVRRGFCGLAGQPKF